MVGQTVGNFRVVAPLGEGGMGAVYEAEHPRIGRRAAIKVLHPEVGQSDPAAVERLFNEARAANAIKHPNIVEIFDCGTLPDGTPYIVMELLEGESLGVRLVRVGRLLPSQAIAIIRQAAGALAAAHAAGIVHRDLKPDNLFLTTDPQTPGRERVKVLDFGIAKLGGGLGAVTGHTRAGQLLGTPTYMAPEQCLGARDVDGRADIYALGVILYQMLVGTPPFVSDQVGALINMHVNLPPPAMRPKNPAITEALEAVVLRTLSKKQTDRYGSVGEMMAAIDAAGVSGSMSLSRGEASGRTGGRQMRDLPIGQTLTTLSSAASSRGRVRQGGRPRTLRLGLATTLAALSTMMLAGTVLELYYQSGSPWFAPDEPGAALSAPAGRPRTGAAAKPAPAPATAPEAPPAAAAAPAGPITIRLDSRPSHVRVVDLADGKTLGRTPLVLERAAGPGTLRLRFEKTGLPARIVEVPLDRDQQKRVTLAE